MTWTVCLVLIYVLFCNRILNGDNSYNLNITEYGKRSNYTITQSTDGGRVDINCEYIGFHRVPLCRIPSAKVFYLANNKIKELYRSSFKFMPRLEKLDLVSNQISLIQGGTFDGLTNLVKLQIYRNNLSELSFNKNSFRSLDNLEELRIDHNNVRLPHRPKFQSALEELSSLRRLEIGGYSGLRINSQFPNLTKQECIIVHSSMSYINDTFDGFINAIVYSSMSYISDTFDGFINNITYINIRTDRVEKDAFRNFPYLKGLSIDGQEEIINILEALWPFENRTFEYLRLNDNGGLGSQQYYTLNSWNVRYLSTICTEELSLRNDFILSIEHSAVRSLVYRNCIKKLDLSSNPYQPTIVYVLSEFRNLEYLNICCRKVENYRTTREIKSTRKRITIARRRKRTPYTVEKESLNALVVYFGKNLMFINASHISSDSPSTNITVIGGDNVVSFDLAYNDGLRCNFFFRGLPNLRILNISYFQCEHLIPVMLHHYPNLKYFVAVAANLGKGLKIDPNGIFFQGLTKLEHVNLANNGLYELNLKLFLDQAHSLKTLILTGNHFLNIPTKLDILQSIEILDLSFNKIRSFTQEAIEYLNLLISNKTNLKFQGNNFSCGCSHMTFLKWIINQKQSISDFHSITCFTEVSRFISLKEMESLLFFLAGYCSVDFWLICSISGIITSSTVLITSVIVLRNRLSVEFFIQRIKWIFSKNKEIDFLYDVFICAATEDISWVKNSLLFYLENTLGLRTCFHLKDFIPGYPTADSIFEGIQNSRKIIFVMTDNYLETEWFQFELEQTRLLMFKKYFENNILMILRERIQLSALPSAIGTLESKMIFLKYPVRENPKDLRRFWKKVKKAFKNHKKIAGETEKLPSESEGQTESMVTECAGQTEILYDRRSRIV